jgi:thiol:disulfide interchange protein
MMRLKNLLPLPLLLLVLLIGMELRSTTSHSQPAEQGITFFEGKLDQALAQAGKENKLVFLDIYAVWCGPCKRLKATTFKDPAVGEYINKRFVSIAINGEKGEGPALAQKLQLTAYPTLYVLDAKGNVLRKMVGFRTAEQLLAELKTQE